MHKNLSKIKNVYIEKTSLKSAFKIITMSKNWGKILIHVFQY